MAVAGDQIIDDPDNGYDLDRAYDEWRATVHLEPIDPDVVRKAVQDSLVFAKSMDARAYTLWRSWDQINNQFSATDSKFRTELRRAQRNIWVPEQPDDYQSLVPELVFVQSKIPIPNVSIWGTERIEFLTNPDPLAGDWEILRHFVSSMEHGGTVGRSMRFIVRDRNTKKYLGIICLSSDFADLKGRDDAIGWKRWQRTDGGMLSHTAIGSVIVPTQPFGYSYVGGKLLSLLLLSDVVAATWERLYGDKLVGITTTSLYGHGEGWSQYSGLNPYWKSYGHSAGSMSLRADRSAELLMQRWMEYAHPRAYWEFYKAQRPSGMPLRRNATELARKFCYRELGIDVLETSSEHQRGIYFSHLYSNSFEFLRGELPASRLVPRFDQSVEFLVDIWKIKHASKRVKNLVAQNKFSRVGLFYDELLGSTWEEARTRFLR